MEDAEHEEILAGAEPRFPRESFLLMRRAGIAPAAALGALGFQAAQLSFLDRALLEIDPWDEERARALGL